MIEFSVLRPSTAYGSPGDEMRLFLTEDGYQSALQSQQRREDVYKRQLQHDYQFGRTPGMGLYGDRGSGKAAYKRVYGRLSLIHI